MLPYHKGSMIRGAFGNSLRHMFCLRDHGYDCEQCDSRATCMYTRLFSPFVEKAPPKYYEGITFAPRPFVLDAMENRKSFKQGQEFSFDLILLGDRTELFHQVILAVARAAERGLSVRHYPFSLRQVEWKNGTWRSLFDGQSLLEIPKARTVTNKSKKTDQIQIHFLTPTRIMIDNEYRIDFTFRELVRQMLRRTLDIAHFYVDEAAPDWDYRDYVRLSDDIQITDRHLYWEDWKRYSSPQNQKLNMGGFFGKMNVQGKLDPFMPLLKQSEVLHVGKGTVLGMGKVRVR